MAVDPRTTGLGSGTIVYRSPRGPSEPPPTTAPIEAAAAPPIISSDLGPAGQLRLLPISSGDVAAGALAVITTIPQVSIRPRHLIVAPEICAYFRIMDIRIGVFSVFAEYSEHGAPASAFAPSLTGADGVQNLEGMPDLPVALRFEIHVRNVGHSAIPFLAVLIGEDA